MARWPPPAPSAFATAAFALPPLDSETNTHTKIATMLKTAEPLRKALSAETDPRSLASFCLGKDVAVVQNFIGVELNVDNLFNLALRMKDSDDLKLVDSFFQNELPGLKGAAAAVNALDGTQPADCKALPFYAANPILLDSLGSDALAIAALLSM